MANSPKNPRPSGRGEVRIGDKVRIKGNARNTTWEFAWIDDIKGNKVCIHYGDKNLYWGLQPQWVEISRLELIKCQE